MARTKGVNRSQLIRDHFNANPKAMAKEIVAALKEQGITVTEGLVYAVKGAMKAKSKRKKRIAQAAKAAATTNGTVSKTDALTMIRDVKALAMRAGGYERLKELVDALAD